MATRVVGVLLQLFPRRGIINRFTVIKIIHHSSSPKASLARSRAAPMLR